MLLYEGEISLMSKAKCVSEVMAGDMEPAGGQAAAALAEGVL